MATPQELREARLREEGLDGQILALMGRGYPYREIAAALSLSEEALQVRIAALLDKLGLKAWTRLHESATESRQPSIETTTPRLSPERARD